MRKKGDRNGEVRAGCRRGEEGQGHRLRLEANPGFRILLAGDYPKYILLYSILLLKKKKTKQQGSPTP